MSKSSVQPHSPAPLLDAQTCARLVEGTQSDPFAVLGKHALDGGWVVRAFVPGAEALTLIPETGATLEMVCLHEGGVFALALDSDPGAYRFAARHGHDTWRVDDPYRFAPLIGALDEHLIGEGRHQRLWHVLGGRVMVHQGMEGVRFGVWAPNACRVSVVGDFNAWDGRRHVLRRCGSTGVWEIFVPGLGAGERYKYELLGHDGLLPLKADPVGFQARLRPDNCSLTARLEGHDWQDSAWMASRAARQQTDAPIAIYEVHLGSWARDDQGHWLDYDALAARLVPYVVEMGFTHIEVLPLTEHPFDGSWGYQPLGLYAPTARHGDMAGFRHFVEAVHGAGLGLILDWVPAHFPTDDHGLARFDGSHLYEHADPREGFHPDWNTAIYNHGRTEVVNFLIANALYWLVEHHIDGLRVDAVASMLYRDYSRAEGEWVPNAEGGRENREAIAFLQAMNTAAYAEDPSIMTVAEESTAWPGVSRPVHDGGLGFGYKWNMGWMHDTLEYVSKDPMYRSHHHGQIGFGLSYAFSENYVLPLSHDEVVHGKGSLLQKMPGQGGERFANLRALYALMYAHPGKKLLFMGQEFAQPFEWNHDQGLPWHLLDDPAHAGIKALIGDLNRLYRTHPALHARDCRADGFEWIDGAAADANVFAWLRRGEDATPPMLAVLNFSGQEHTGWRLGVPAPGFWAERLNTDAARYGGGDRGNLGGAQSEAVGAHGRAHSLVLTLPPLSGLFFELAGD
ncbi:MAG: 1,4-alpha-glucan branching protein GlgB [Pseudomonadota bacterium]